MSTEEFAQQMKTVQKYAGAVYRQAYQSKLEQPELLAAALENLHAALEDLHTSEEELRRQHEELIATRQNLEVERRRYRDLFEFAPDGYLVTDPIGVIQEANHAASVLFNLPQRSIVGKPLNLFILGLNRDHLIARVQQLHHPPQSPEWIVQVVPKDKPIFDAALTVASVQNQDNCSVALRWLVRDITDRQQAEMQMQQIRLQNLQLMEASRLKSQFLGVMSHELRTPMNAILGFAQLLLRQQQHQQNSPQANIVERILSNGKHLLRLIEDILDFSRMEAGRIELKREVFDLVQLVLGVTEEFCLLAERKELDLAVEIATGNSQMIGDSHRVRQVLVNLLSNAIKFTTTGAVTVRMEEVGNDRIAISVQDTGIGIAATDLRLIFTEFQQVNQTISREYNGTGLGLAIVEALVQLMHGTITVESQVGEGSTFRVELPRQPPEDIHRSKQLT